MDRRQFLRSLASVSSVGAFSSGLAFELLSCIARAQGAENSRNLILVRLHGAFDSVQCLNPWTGALPDPKDLFFAYDPSQIGSIGDYTTVLRKVGNTEINLGPSGHALAKYANKMAVINGIAMGPVDLGHPFAAQYMVSGRTQERAPSLSSLVAHERSATDQFFIVNGPVEKGEYKLKILQTVNLKAGLSSGSGAAASFVGAYGAGSPHLDGHRSFSKRKAAIEQFTQIMTELKPENTERNDSGGITPAIEAFAQNEMDDVAAVGALSSKLASVVQLDWQMSDGGSPDSHALYVEQHPAAQRNRWDRLARLLGRLEKYRLLENTLVVVTTEFSRTPALNTNGGKDHNYMDNSALFIGAGIRGGTVLGSHRLFGRNANRSESALTGDFIDFGGGTGKIFDRPEKFRLRDLPSGYGLIRPPDVLRTALEIVQPSIVDLLGHEAKTLPRILS